MRLLRAFARLWVRVLLAAIILWGVVILFVILVPS